MARGSIEVRLRPVGSTSARPRLGAPAGPGATRRASSAASRAARSQSAEARTAVSAPVAAASRRIVSSSGDSAEDVQAVADAELLDVAELGIELGDGLAVGLALHQAAVGGQSVGPGALDDLLFEEDEPPAVEAVGRGIFLDDAFQLGERPVQAGRAERRRQMADGDGTEPPLGLHRLARIVDDEGIDHRQRAQHDLGPAAARQRQRLAGQPFQGAVRAEMDQRVDPDRAARHRRRHRHGSAGSSCRGSPTCDRRSSRGRAAAAPAPCRNGGRAGGRHRPVRPRPRSTGAAGSGDREPVGGNFDVLDIAGQQALDVGGAPVASAGVVAFGLQQASGSRRRWRRCRGRRHNRCARRAPDNPTGRAQGAARARGVQRSCAQAAASRAT